MKKLFFVLAVSSFAACGGGSTEVKTDSTTVKTDSVTTTTVDSSKTMVDSTHAAGKDSMKVDSMKK